MENLSLINLHLIIMFVFLSIFFGLSLFDILFSSKAVRKRIIQIFHIQVPSQYISIFSIIISVLAALYGKQVVGSWPASLLIFIICLVILLIAFYYVSPDIPKDDQSTSQNRSNSDNSYSFFFSFPRMSQAILIISFLGFFALPLSLQFENQDPTIFNFTLEPEEFQIYGQPVVFTANADDINNDQIFYRFLIDDIPTRNWSKANKWVWNTPKLNESKPNGKYKVEVQVKDSKYFDHIGDNRSRDYTLASIEILNPVDDESVIANQDKSTNKQIKIYGSAKGINEFQRDIFWIFVKDSRASYHPQDWPGIYINECNWSANVSLYGQTGKPQEIVLVMLNNRTELETIAKYFEINRKIDQENKIVELNQESDENLSTKPSWPGLSCLPQNAKELDYVKIYLNSSELQANIIEPKNKFVSYKISVKGEYSGERSTNNYLWLLVGNGSLNQWWPQGVGNCIVLKNNDKNWSVDAQVGREGKDIGIEYQITVILVDKKVNEELISYMKTANEKGWPHIDLPPCKVLDEKSVYRI